jgi:hypothetical protein
VRISANQQRARFYIPQFVKNVMGNSFACRDNFYAVEGSEIVNALLKFSHFSVRAWHIVVNNENNPARVRYVLHSHPLQKFNGKRTGGVVGHARVYFTHGCVSGSQVALCFFGKKLFRNCLGGFEYSIQNFILNFILCFILNFIL